MTILYEMTRRWLVAIVIVLIASSISYRVIYARVGVGMGAGEIRITENVKPGGIYNLPSLRIFNTGDEKTTYGMDIAYHQDHPELRPGQSWFSFIPAKFMIEPGKSQEVSVTMTIPVKTIPGDYFAFVESGPMQETGPGTSVGVAVASKLFFTVVPANMFQAIGYRVTSFFFTYSPWTWIISILIIFVIIVIIFKKFFSFNIAVRKN